MRIRITKRYILAFLCLTILCGTSHEFVHHFMGRAICGCFGYKTFNSFTLCPGCEAAHPLYYWATIAGPLFTFFLMWIGLYQLSKPDNKNKQLGFALIFANFPINRIMFALMGWNDEQWTASILFHNSISFWITNLLIWICTIPPLVVAYKSIQNKRKFFVFLGFFILPFIFVFLFAGLFLEEWLLLKQKFLNGTVIGIPYLIILVELLCLYGYLSQRKYLFYSKEK